MRSKRRCVLEKKQPYSGDEWCSGPDTEEDEDKLHTATHQERGLAGPVQGLSDRLSAGPVSEPAAPVMGCGVGPGLKTEQPPQPSQQVVYVFTTGLANSAAEAVMKGQTDSILLFHQQNVSRPKLEQVRHPQLGVKLNKGHSSGKLPNLSEKMNSSSSPPTGTPKSQCGTPRPASAGAGGPLHPAGTPSSAGHSDNESSQTRPGGASSNNSIVAHRSEAGSTATPACPVPGAGDGEGAGGMSLPVATISPSGSPSMLSAHLQGDPCQRSGPGNMDGLSKEQLEHRERSLQTLRDIERLLLRSGAGGGPGDTGATNNNASNNSSNLNNNNNTDRSGILEDRDNGTNSSGNCGSGNMLSTALASMGGMKKYEEPLQSIISQTQSLAGPVLDSPHMDSHHNLPQHPHHQLSSPGLDMGHLLGPDGLTPEQVAWRKLQEEYYQDKRRQQEIQPPSHPQHLRMMTEIGMQGGPQMRDLVDSPLGSSLTMNMNPQMNVQQQQQQMMLSQKLRGGPAGGGTLGEMFSPGDISRIRASHNGRGVNKGMIPGPDGPFQFPNHGPFSGGQVEGPFLQQPGPEMFGPDQQGHHQMGGTSRLSHMPMSGVLRGVDLGPRHPSELSININPRSSPSVPRPHQLKSPSLNREPSPLLPSPSAPGLKSPPQISSAGHHPTLPPASGAGTPSSSSMKSPQIMGSSNLGLHSPSASPGQLKSPAMAVGSPGWASPKTALPSPGGPTSGKVVGNGGSSSTETGQSLPPRSSNSTPVSQPGSMNPGMPFTSSPDNHPTPNPLSLIMSQMSKYAMPSSTPLYHDAIKTIATSDDEMLPDRPLLSGVSIGGNMGNPQTSQLLVSQGSIGPHSNPQSPMGIVSQGQQHLPHDSSGPVLSSPNQMGMPAMMGGGAPDGMGPCNVSPISQSQMAGFSRIQPPPHGPMHSPIGGMSHNFSQSNEDILPPQQLHLSLLRKGHPHQRPSHPSDSFASLHMGDGPDLSEVIRTNHSGIPEFDLSRIIPSDKPSSTLQYFPKSEPHQNLHQGPLSQQPTPQQLLKQLSSSGPPHSSGPSSNPHLANLQNMMAEQQLAPHPSHVGIRQNMGIPQGGSRGMVSGGGMGPMCPPGHMMGRTGMAPQQQLQQQQAMMANSLLHHPSNPYPGMMSSQQHSHNLMAQQNIMMMQAKQRSMSIPGDPFGPQGPLMSPQGPMMAPSHPQAGMMGPQSLRQRGMSLDSTIGYGPGGMAHMPF
ncbi:B-cell CLL/lymphoma 9-like protein isoform X5 [Anarrhichthys ocellatus]|uniref:B-cell CLL/lymphoma 9-like protein isoform X5 n=1 Tax=Anarrhichthys ocellatus TaxID=433405 RepID=UPI0012EE0C77|nr:B-cell CLL/lymphoma 9-like protein isoform X5 [Anarrhichthys ocellatus]